MPRPHRRRLASGLLLLGLLAPAGARAQGTIAPPACLRGCEAATAIIRSNPPPVQACLIRCAAGLQFQREAGRIAATGRGLPPAGPSLAAFQGQAGGRSGAVYLAPAPSAGFGLAYGLADRIAAHGQAERQCRARGDACRPALEFADRCGAVAQARRSNGLVRTADPGTYTVTFAAGGAGPTLQAAEGQALAGCAGRDRTATCEVVASGCGG